MEDALLQKKPTAEGSRAGVLWDPFWFVDEMFGWTHPVFDVKETDDAYVYKLKVKLTLPGQVDVAHVKAEIENGQLTLVVPKEAVAAPEPATPPPPKAAAATSVPGRNPRRGARTRARHH